MRYACTYRKNLTVLFPQLLMNNYSILFTRVEVNHIKLATFHCITVNFKIKLCPNMVSTLYL